MDYYDNISYNKRNVLYKGVDIGVSIENLQDLRYSSNVDVECILENLYQSCVINTRNKKIDDIIGYKNFFVKI